MRKSFINVLQISVILGDIPQYAPIDDKKCQTGSYYFATNFYTKRQDTAKNNCKINSCDVIIEWTRTNSKGQRFTGFDLGKFDGHVCPQNKDMTARIIWQRQPVDNEYTNLNSTINGYLTFRSTEMMIKPFF